MDSNAEGWLFATSFKSHIPPSPHLTAVGCVFTEALNKDVLFAYIYLMPLNTPTSTCTTSKDSGYKRFIWLFCCVVDWKASLFWGQVVLHSSQCLFVLRRLLAAHIVLFNGNREKGCLFVCLFVSRRYQLQLFLIISIDSVTIWRRELGL